MVFVLRWGLKVYNITNKVRIKIVSVYEFSNENENFFNENFEYTCNQLLEHCVDFNFQWFLSDVVTGFVLS